MGETKSTPQSAPNYALYREGVAAPDSLPVTSVDAGINMSGFHTANVQVIPAGGANPTVEIMWWCPQLGQFIRDHTALTRAGVGANTPFEFSIDVRGRIMLVAFTAIAAGSARVMVSGASPTRE